MKRESLRESIERIRAVPAKWKHLAHPILEMQRIRADRMENLSRARHGLPSKDQEIMEKFKTRIETFYARGRDPKRWRKRNHGRHSLKSKTSNV